MLPGRPMLDFEKLKKKIMGGVKAIFEKQKKKLFTEFCNQFLLLYSLLWKRKKNLTTIYKYASKLTDWLLTFWPSFTWLLSIVHEKKPVKMVWQIFLNKKDKHERKRLCK